MTWRHVVRRKSNNKIGGLNHFSLRKREGGHIKSNYKYILKSVTCDKG